jgi:hypothetical protein
MITKEEIAMLELLLVKLDRSRHELLGQKELTNSQRNRVMGTVAMEARDHVRGLRKSLFGDVHHAGIDRRAAG